MDEHDYTKYPTGKLLLDEYPLQVLPSLAVEIGLNEAIFLQQLHWWLVKPGAHIRDGKVWVYNTYEGWREQFPWWGIATIRRLVRNLEERELIETSTEFNKWKVDNTKWYTINYDQVIRLTTPSAEINRPPDQSDQTT